MNKWTVLATLIIISAAFFMFNLTLKKPLDLISPLLKEQKVLGLNQWLPMEGTNQIGGPVITAKAAFFTDTKSGQVLFAKNIHQKLPIASLVKVMTVLIALENKKLSDTFFVSRRAAGMEPDKMLLIEGEKLTLEELLSGIFLISANDAAEVLAEDTIGDRGDFLKLMNDRAKQLGMKDSYFANPTGLDEDSGNSYSSAYDLAILTRYLIRHFPEVVDISKNEHVFIPRTEEHQDYDMYSGINLLRTYPGVVGFKTGYTPEAGMTLITLARKEGLEVVGVLLGSEKRRDEAKELLDYSFSKLN